MQKYKPVNASQGALNAGNLGWPKGQKPARVRIKQRGPAGAGGGGGGNG